MKIVKMTASINFPNYFHHLQTTLLFSNTLMGAERTRIRSQCKGPTLIIGSDWSRKFPGLDHTENKGGKKNLSEKPLPPLL